MPNGFLPLANVVKWGNAQGHAIAALVASLVV
jgi:hypothetical protein